MQRRRLTLAAATSLVALVPAVVFAQVQQAAGSPRVLAPTSSNAAAAVEVRAAMDRNDLWDFAGAMTHAARALEMDSTLGVARAFAAQQRGGPTQRAEYVRATTDASSASAPEALVTLAMREAQAGRGAVAVKIAKTAADLVPDDARVAVWAAQLLSDTARLDALRAAAARYPDYAGANMWLAYYLTQVPPAAARANAAEALRAAQSAQRIAPNEAGPHVAMASVLTFTGRHSEAGPHLDAAARMGTLTTYGYLLRAQIASYDRNTVAMRAALDSGVAVSSNFNQMAGARRARALVALEEGNPKQALAELGQQLGPLEAANARAEIQNQHVWMAYVAAVMGDSAGAEAHLAAGDAAGIAPVGSAAYHMIAYSVIHNGPGARKAHDDWMRIAGTGDADAVHRYHGLTFLAEGKGAEAEAELRQDHSGNPYGTMGLIEALRLQKKSRDADSVLAAFNNDHTYFYGSVAVPMIRYRAAHR